MFVRRYSLGRLVLAHMALPRTWQAHLPPLPSAVRADFNKDGRVDLAVACPQCGAATTADCVGAPTTCAVCQAVNGVDLLGPQLWIERPTLYRKPKVERATRIGVDYAGDWAKKPWRFFDRESPYVSTVTPAQRKRALAGKPTG